MSHLDDRAEEDPDRVDRLLQSHSRWRVALGVLTILIPLGLYAIFERQARRLDALGDHGVPVMATVTDVPRDGSSNSIVYEYAVGGTRYSWSADRQGVAPSVGDAMPAVYLPEDPSLSRPGADRKVAAEEATANRAFTWKVVAGAVWFLAMNLLMVHVRLRRLQATRRTEVQDPIAYRTRLALSGVMVAPLLALVVGWHAVDSMARGESLVPVTLAVILTLGIGGGTGYYVLRDGMAGAAARSQALMKWLVPALLALASLRAIAWALGWQ